MIQCKHINTMLLMSLNYNYLRESLPSITSALALTSIMMVYMLDSACNSVEYLRFYCKSGGQMGKTSPQAPYTSTAIGTHTQFSSVYFWSCWVFFLTSAERAADLAVVPASKVRFEPSGETTVKPSAAGLEQTQFSRRTSAGLDAGVHVLAHS